MWRHLKGSDHLSNCSRQNPTKCSYCALLEILVCFIDGKTPVESASIHRFNKYALNNKGGHLLPDSHDSSPVEIDPLDKLLQDPSETLNLLLLDE